MKHLSQVNSTLYCFSQCHIFTHISIRTVSQGHHGLTKASFNKRDYIFILICEDYAYHITQKEGC